MNKRIGKILDTLDVGWVYGSWKSLPHLPFVVIMGESPSQVAADGKVYHSFQNLRLELYTKTKDFELEQLLEEALCENDIYWEKSMDIPIEENSLMRVDYNI